MSDFFVNDDMFGFYARIPTGFSNEPHEYKIVSRLSSNWYCDLPLGTCKTKETLHGKVVPILLVIHCGLDETEVKRVKEADCEIVNSHLREVAELTELLTASKAGQFSLQKAWEQDKAELTARAKKAEQERDAAIKQMCRFCRTLDKKAGLVPVCAADCEWRGKAGKEKVKEAPNE